MVTNLSQASTRLKSSSPSSNAIASSEIAKQRLIQNRQQGTYTYAPQQLTPADAFSLKGQIKFGYAPQVEETPPTFGEVISTALEPLQPAAGKVKAFFSSPANMGTAFAGSMVGGATAVAMGLDAFNALIAAALGSVAAALGFNLSGNNKDRVNPIPALSKKNLAGSWEKSIQFFRSMGRPQAAESVPALKFGAATEAAERLKRVRASESPIAYSGVIKFSGVSPAALASATLSNQSPVVMAPKTNAFAQAGFSVAATRLQNEPALATPLSKRPAFRKNFSGLAYHNLGSERLGLMILDRNAVTLLTAGSREGASEKNKSVPVG